MDLGLDRVAAVACRLHLTRPAGCVISVAGTNGKGATIVFLAAMLQAQGYRTGSYTSPHLLRYNERISVDGQPISDPALCNLFERIEAVRGDARLTYFEYATLAALTYSQDLQLDVMLLEVGLGGRLDAVNIVDADVAVVASTGLDHLNWLGPDRDAVGREKAGIGRSGKPMVIGERDPPAGLMETAQAIGAELIRLGTDYDYDASGDTWCWRGVCHRREALPAPGLRGAHQLQNASAALAAIEAAGLCVEPAAVAQGLAGASLPGRYQRLHRQPQVVLDVAHNAEAAAALAATLAGDPVAGRHWALLAMLEDKPAERVAAALDDIVDHWLIAGLADEPRGLTASALMARLPSLHGSAAQHESVELAYNEALEAAQPGDRIIVFGSFLTVEKVLRVHNG